MNTPAPDPIDGPADPPGTETMEVQQLDDGSVRVKLTLDGISADGVVSSWHLVEPKANQLRNVIAQIAAASYAAPDQPSPTTNDA